MLYDDECKRIRIFHTHIEISPYDLGENVTFEHTLSTWIEAEHDYKPIAYHWDEGSKTIFIPRGINQIYLEKTFRSTPVMMRDADEVIYVKGVHTTKDPRDRIQEEAVKFLTCQEEFTKVSKYSQQALTLDTGDGKTYSCISAIVYYGMRAMIITHRKSIRMEWINEFLDKSTVTRDQMIIVDGSDGIKDIMKEKMPKWDYYFVNHQTLHSYGSTYGWKAVRDFFQHTGVGIKVYDEAHRCFEDILKVDMFSDTKKTFYLTANFFRNDDRENRIFKKAFSSVYQFGEETKTYKEKRKHIIYVPCLYRSNPSPMMINHIEGGIYRFSVYRFSYYALHADKYETMRRVFLGTFELASRLEGRILITMARIPDNEMVRDWLITEYSDMDKTIGIINSERTQEENEYVKQHADIICTTIKSCGEGLNIKGLRCIINMEPFSAKITANQLTGRLREYAPDKDTYIFDLIDIAFPSCKSQFERKKKYLAEKKCKEVQVRNVVV